MELKDKNGLTEKEFLEIYKTKNYKRPYVTADVVIFCKDSEKVLLIKRGGHPFLGYYALPGGFVKDDETIKEGAKRELFEETGINNVDLTLVGEYSKPGRDPRGWIISIAYLVIVNESDISFKAGDDAKEAMLMKISEINNLAFDHELIIKDALNKIKNNI